MYKHTIYFKKLKEGAIIPTKAHEDDAGLDLYACLDEPMVLAGGSVVIPTGISWMPEIRSMEYFGHNITVTMCLIVQSRSGMAFKHGIEASNAGVIDAGYRGEIKVKLYNWSGKSFTVEPGMRIAQAVPQLVPLAEIVEAEELIPSYRGEKGFGSSGYICQE